MYYSNVRDLIGDHAEVDDPTSPNNGDYGEVVEAWNGVRFKDEDFVTADGSTASFTVSSLMFSAH